MWQRTRVLILAALLGVASSTPVDVECPLFCSRRLEPVCDAEGRMHSNECVLRQAACESDDVTPIICTMEYAPVCGNDGITYGNQCQLEAMGCLNVEKASDGECPESADKRETHACDWSCEGEEDEPTCGTDGNLYPNHCVLHLEACRAGYTFGLRACDRHKELVCGSDGKIYGNPCMLEAEACKGVTQADWLVCGMEYGY